MKKNPFLGGLIALVSTWLMITPAAAGLTPSEVCNTNINYGNAKVRYCRNRALSTVTSNVTRAIVAIHGHRIDAKNFMSRVQNDLGAGQDWSKTTIVAPFFLHEDDLDSLGITDPAVMRWDGPGWKRGDTSQPPPYPYSYVYDRASSYDIIDFLVKHLILNNEGLQDIVIIGYSAGAQAVQKYLAGTRIVEDYAVPRDIDVKFVVVAPESYMWLNGQRPEADYTSCSNYNRYKYGMASFQVAPNRNILLNANSYMTRESVSVMRDRAITSTVRYVVGYDDDEVDTSLDCEVTVQGEHRRARRDAFYDSLKQYFPANNITSYHRKLTLMDAGHSSSSIFKSSYTTFVQAVFGSW